MHGEHHFRTMEAQALQALSLSSPSVIALGGGSLSNPDIERFVTQRGTLILLFIPIIVHLPRLNNYLPESLKYVQNLSAVLHDRQTHMLSLAHHCIDMTHVNLFNYESITHTCKLISSLLMKSAL